MVSLTLGQLMLSSVFGAARQFTKGSGRSGAGNPCRSAAAESIFEPLDSSEASCLCWRRDIGLVKVVGAVVLRSGELKSDAGSIIRDEKRGFLSRRSRSCVWLCGCREMIVG